MKITNSNGDRAAHGLFSKLIGERGESPIAILIGLTIFVIIGVTAMLGIQNAVSANATSSVNAERTSALRTELAKFHAETWQVILDRSRDGIQRITHIPVGDEASAKSSTPFPYSMRVIRNDNTESNISTPGGPTNSDGSYRIELIAPKLNHQMSECDQFPSVGVQIDTSKCIYVSSVRSPRFSDAASVPDWRGLKSTFTDQVYGVATITGNASVDLAVIDTCAMQINTVRVSFVWTPTDISSTLQPTGLIHLLSDERIIEVVPIISSGSVIVGDFNRGSVSVCGPNDRIRLSLSGSGSGELSALMITPVAEILEPGSDVPGPIVNPKLQVDTNGTFTIAWDKPILNSSNAPISYSVMSACQTEPIVVAPLNEPDNLFSGGNFVIPMGYGETIEQHIDRCPIYRVTPTGDLGVGPVTPFNLSSIDTEFTGMTATRATDGTITVSYPTLHAYVKDRISQLAIHYCYQPIDRPGDGCFVAPILDIDRSVNAGSADFRVATSFAFSGPSANNVKDSTIILQGITVSSRTGEYIGTNTIRLILE